MHGLDLTRRASDSGLVFSFIKTMIDIVLMIVCDKSQTLGLG